MASFVITDHAAERFSERYCGGSLGVNEAKARLAEAAVSAVRLKEKTLLGQAQWQIDSPRAVLVVKHDPRMGPVVVTVLPSAEPLFGMTEDELEIVREWSARQPPTAEIVALDEAKAARAASNLAKVRPKPKERKGPVSLARDPLARAAQLAHLEHARARDAEKTRRHDEGQMLLLGRLKRALRVAAMALARRAADGDPEAYAALEAIQREDPGYVTVAFLEGKKGK